MKHVLHQPLFLQYLVDAVVELAEDRPRQVLNT